MRRRNFIQAVAAAALVEPSINAASETFRAAEAASIREMLNRYSAAFRAKDYVTLAAVCDVPFIRVRQANQSIASSDELIADFRATRDALDSRGYDRSEDGEPRVIALAADSAMVNRSYRRLRADGSVLEERAVFYLVGKRGGSWKLTGTIAQDHAHFGKTY